VVLVALAAVEMAPYSRLVRLVQELLIPEVVEEVVLETQMASL
jgi:hypothetical protein